ncbi:hypothetical protein QOZ80_7AG0580890 [Eleusine coracana subsp. coracana]|nr:hypothetical protein QOZ80_7AG0580890 [Eleusine coracana subsp. coracana]
MEKLGVVGTQQDEGDEGDRPQHRRCCKGSDGGSFYEDGTNGNYSNESNNYDPRCGISKEEFEWRCAQQKKVSQRMPQALHKLKICSEKTRRHFLDDPDALEEWDEYVNDVYDSFENHLQHSLSLPLKPLDSVRYRHIMKGKAHSKTSVGMLSEGMVKLSQAAGNRSIVLAGAIMMVGTVAGLAVDQWKKRHNET